MEVGMTPQQSSSAVMMSSSTSSAVSMSSKVSFMSVVANSRDVALPFPFRTIRTVAIAITSLVSFVPVWKLYLPGLWFSQVRPDLVWSSPKTCSSNSTAGVRRSWSASNAYNEVNDPRLRRDLAQQDPQPLFGILESQRQVCEFVNSRGQTLFTQSWMPAMSLSSPRSMNMKGLVVLLHGLNEHSGRYAHFATKLNSQGYGVYAMDWIGHGGSDGLHGYVDSLDQVVLDTKLYLKQVTAEHPNVPMFLFGHSTGGAIALKTSFLASDEKLFRGIVLTSPAVRVKPSHPIVAALAPIFSFLLPRYQFKGATKVGTPVSRDPLALLAKYSDPLVYTGPIRIRTGTEILRLGSFLERNLEKITIPFLVLHGSHDQVTDPQGSQDLFDKAASKHKNIQIYEGLLHDLLFELEKDDVTGDIIQWLDSMLQHL